jgi:EAL domain-containing protein (putative c-di-GMP-specific phosphodiesterase class I)
MIGAREHTRRVFSEKMTKPPQIQEKRAFKAGETILRQGEQGTCAYFIESGKVEILMERPDGAIHRVGTRGPGTIIGEMAIVDNNPRIATVRALEDCRMLEITREDFARRLNASDPVLQIITQVILTRYRDTLTRAEILGEVGTLPTPEQVERGYVAQTDAVETVKIANEFQDALDKNQLSLHYQPIVSLENGQVSGFEALMRWKHPERGYISPAIFIPVAEETGLIVSASGWALRESCQALKRIESIRGYNRSLFMSVNFSSTDFASENFVETLYNILSATDVPARQIHLEITERILMQQPENARDTLLMCRKAGMGIAIDDFGTGYSSLSYLHYFPIDTLKIDRSFVKDMFEKDSSRELVRSIVMLGKNLKMKVIAEGVETLEEAVLLREMGCDLAQGYYFAKPLAESDIVALLHEWTPKKLAS